MEFRLQSLSPATKETEQKIKVDDAAQSMEPLKYYSTEQTWDQYKITGRYQETADQREREKGLLECSMADPQRARR